MEFTMKVSGSAGVIITPIVFLIVGQFSYGQFLPRGLSDGEKQLIAEGWTAPATDLPGAITLGSLDEAPRSMAEWEELQAIVITWTQYRPILTEIVRHAIEEVEVVIVNQNEMSVRNYLSARGVDPDSNITYVAAPFNSVWIRDYGANPVYVGGWTRLSSSTGFTIGRAHRMMLFPEQSPSISRCHCTALLRCQTIWSIQVETI